MLSILVISSKLKIRQVSSLLIPHFRSAALAKLPSAYNTGLAPPILFAKITFPSLIFTRSRGTSVPTHTICMKWRGRSQKIVFAYSAEANAPSRVQRASRSSLVYRNWWERPSRSAFCFSSIVFVLEGYIAEMATDGGRLEPRTIAESAQPFQERYVRCLFWGFRGQEQFPLRFRCDVVLSGLHKARCFKVRFRYKRDWILQFFTIRQGTQSKGKLMFGLSVYVS